MTGNIFVTGGAGTWYFHEIGGQEDLLSLPYESEHTELIDWCRLKSRSSDDIFFFPC